MRGAPGQIGYILADFKKCQCFTCRNTNPDGLVALGGLFKDGLTL